MKNILVCTCLVLLNGMSAEAIKFYNDSGDKTTFIVHLTDQKQIFMRDVAGAEITKGQPRENLIVDQIIANYVTGKKIKTIKIEAKNENLQSMYCKYQGAIDIPLPQDKTKEELMAYLKERVVMFSPQGPEWYRDVECTFK